MNDEKNFVVRTFGKVTVTRSINFDGAKSSLSIETSAVARREGRGAIQLWLAGNVQVDMYEVATSLCRLLFDAYKVDDALLFVTMLSTDLRTLQRRGYKGDYDVPSCFDPADWISSVDHIPNLQQETEREAAAGALAKGKADRVPLVPIPPIPPKLECVPAPTLTQAPTPASERSGDCNADQLGPQALEKPITYLVTPLTNIGKSVLRLLGPVG